MITSHPPILGTPAARQGEILTMPIAVAGSRTYYFHGIFSAPEDEAKEDAEDLALIAARQGEESFSIDDVLKRLDG